MRMPEDEPANIYALCQPEPSTAHKREAPRRSYVDQISGYLCSNEQIKIHSRRHSQIREEQVRLEKICAAPNQPDR
jgi:hypothetical protein